MTRENTKYLIVGRIANLTLAHSRTNLLEKLQKNSSANNLVAGIAGALTGMHGMVANAALLESYEGEDVELFACYIGDKIVVGEFDGVHLLNNGDEVKAVVSQDDKVLFAHAIMRPKSGLLWLPLETDSGTSVVFKRMMKIALLSFIIGGFGFSILAIIFGLSSKIILLMLSIGIVISALVGAWVAHDMKSFGEDADEIFSVLGFPNVKKLDMRAGMHSLHNPGHIKSVYHYQWVLDSHVKGKKRGIYEKMPHEIDEAARHQKELARKAHKEKLKSKTR